MPDPSPVTAPSRRFPSRPDSVPAARKFVCAELSGTPAAVVEDAALLVSELVTNAVLHAQTEIEVRAWAARSRVHVQVSDWEPRRGLVPRKRSLDGSTGRGLELVELIASCCGIDAREDCKTVWFELWPSMPGTPPPPVVGWGRAPSPSGPTVTMTLPDLPFLLCTAAQRHQDALLRECLLAAFTGGRLGAQFDDLLVAHTTNQAISAGMASALEACPTDSLVCPLRVSIPIDTASAVLTLRRVLEYADRAAIEGRLLTRPALPEVRRFRDWLLDQILRRLAGEQLKPWSSMSVEPDSAPAALSPWDPPSMQIRRIPTVAADDRNQIIAVNAAAAHLLGWEAEDLVGQRIVTLIPHNLRERHVAGFTSLLLTGKSGIIGRPVSFPALRRDGQTVPVSLLIQIQESIDGRTVFVAELTPQA